MHNSQFARDLTDATMFCCVGLYLLGIEKKLSFMPEQCNCTVASLPLNF